MEDSRSYEFAYHITTQLDEAKVPVIQQEVESLIAKHGGVILFSQQPEPKRLSYPLKHQKQSFFAWVQFSLPESENAGALLAELDEWARLHPEILRSIVLRLETESDKRAIRQAEHLERKAAKAAKESATVKKTKPEKKAEDQGKLEKELEEIIGNL